MTIFSKIVAGEIPSYKVAESENFYAFLDINPLKMGHTLVIPKKTEEDYIFNLDDRTYEGLMMFSKKVAKAIEGSVECKRIAVLVLGLEVPHTHIHLVPIDSEADLNISKPKVKATPEEMAATAGKILENFEKNN